MKKIFMMLALSVSLVFAACGDGNVIEESNDSADCNNDNDDSDLIVDYAPIEFFIAVKSAEGVDLLNSENEDALDLTSIKLNYKGESYELQEVVTRDYLAVFKGMMLIEKDGTKCIYVGEFDGDPSFEGDTFAINWGDGSLDYFSYTNQKVGKYDVDHNFFHNGQPVKSGGTPYISITVIK